MAFSLSAVQSLTNSLGGGGVIWLYKSEDPLNSITQEGYFTPMASSLSIGDVIFVTTVTGLNTSSELHIASAVYRVTATSPTVVII